MYRIESHLHTKYISVCGWLEAEELAKRYHEAGYHALAVTDHYNVDTWLRLGIDARQVRDVMPQFTEGFHRLEQGAACQALLLDNALADMDTLTFCHRLQQLDPGCRPALLLALTCDVRELDSLFRPENGVRPCAPRLSSLSSLLLDLKSLLASSPRPNAGSVNRLLASWGAPSQMVGVVYLRESVCLALQYDSHFAIRKDILQEVGDWHTITDEAVDSGIRRLIDALDRKKAPAWLSFRQRHHLPQGSKLTTGTFIYEVRDELLSPPPAPNAPSEGEPQPDEREPQPAACV